MLKTLSSQEKKAVRVYDDEIRRGQLHGMPLWVDSFVIGAFTGLPQNPEIIDVGCGFGRAIPVINELGIKRYFGIDPSVLSIEYCRQKFPDCKFEVDEIRTIGSHYPNRFEAFFLTAVLMHIPFEDLGIAIGSLRQSLKKGAVGLFSLPVDRFRRKTVKTEFGLTITFFTPREVMETFSANNFVLREVCSPDGHMLLGNAVAI